MKVLVINSGSSTLKYQLIDVKNNIILCKGICDRIGIQNSYIDHEVKNGKKVHIDIDLKTHKDSLKRVLSLLISKDYGNIIDNLYEIEAIGHRIVHGGEYFEKSVIVD